MPEWTLFWHGVPTTKAIVGSNRLTCGGAQHYFVRECIGYQVNVEPRRVVRR